MVPGVEREQECSRTQLRRQVFREEHGVGVGVGLEKVMGFYWLRLWLGFSGLDDVDVNEFDSFVDVSNVILFCYVMVRVCGCARNGVM